MAIDIAKIDLWKTVKTYWLDDRSNVFNNFVDAIFGIVVLLLFPAASLITVFVCESIDWSNYLFPILSISAAGMYDAYGRYEVGSPRNVKLGLRVAFDGIAVFLAAFFTGTNEKMVAMIPPILLILCGLILMFEAIERIRVAIEISEWSSLR